MRRARPVLAILFLALAILAPRPAAAQCAMCKTSLTQSEEGRGISAEFNRAILVMLAGPYAMMACAAAYLLRGHLRVLAGRVFSRVRPGARSAFLRG